MAAQPVPLLGQSSSGWYLPERSICHTVGHLGVAELGQHPRQIWLCTVLLLVLAEGVACHIHPCAGRCLQENCSLA